MIISQVKYDALGRIFQWNRKIGSSDHRLTEYHYDLDSRVNTVLVNGQQVLPGRHGNKQEEEGEESEGRRCHRDEDGFVIGRGVSESFEWNSRGRLIRWRSNETGQTSSYRFVENDVISKTC